LADRRPGSERRVEIVEATLELLGRLPLSAVSTRAIAAEVGISQPALFRHFRTREAILVAVVAQVRAELEAAAAGCLEAGGDRIERLCMAMLALVERRRGVPRLLFAHAADQKGAVRDAAASMLRAQRALLAELLRKEAGRVSPEDGARYLVAAIQGLALQWEMDGGRGPLATRAAGLVAAWREGVGGGQRLPTASSGRIDGLRQIDVRPILAAHGEPLPEVLSCLAELAPGSGLRVVAPFAPAPLVKLLASRGHHVELEEVGPERFHLDVVVGGEPTPVDLRELEAPEPLERVLQAVADLRTGAVLHARTPRVPVLLLGRLEERGLDYAVVDGPSGAWLWVRRPEV
jgi:AcrR family transcriptional regulator/uncharacterized protein (DUF2249 family)